MLASQEGLCCKQSVKSTVQTYVFHLKCPILSDFTQISSSVTDFRTSPQYQISWKSVPVGATLIRAVICGEYNTRFSLLTLKRLKKGARWKLDVSESATLLVRIRRIPDSSLGAETANLTEGLDAYVQLPHTFRYIWSHNKNTSFQTLSNSSFITITPTILHNLSYYVR